METTFWEGTCQHGIFLVGVLEAGDWKGGTAGQQDSVVNGDCGIGEETGDGGGRWMVDGGRWTVDGGQ